MREIRFTVDSRDGGELGAWVMRERYSVGLPNGRPTAGDLQWLEHWLDGVVTLARQWAGLGQP